MESIRIQIVQKAKELGASAAGIASVSDLKSSPSHKMMSKFGTGMDGSPIFERMENLFEITWPEKAKSALVIGISHPQNQPELDWFDEKGNSPGNRILIFVIRKLSAWIESAYGIKTHPMPYFPEQGGICLKDAAVTAGLDVSA